MFERVARKFEAEAKQQLRTGRESVRRLGAASLEMSQIFRRLAEIQDEYNQRAWDWDTAPMLRSVLQHQRELAQLRTATSDRSSSTSQ